MDKIIVAVDGSEHAMRALEKAKELGLAFGSKIVIVNVVDSFHYHVNIDDSIVSERLLYLETSKKSAEALLVKAKERLDELGDQVETVLLDGDPPHMLINYIESSDADLVVIGSHGVKGLRQFMLGSVVSKLIHHVDKSVMIVR